MSADRKAIRKAMATLLSAALVGTGKLAQAVYAFQIGDFKGASPVVTCTSGGTQRERLTWQGTNSAHWLNIHVFVLYAMEDGSWTEENCEDALDDICKTILDTVDANQVTANWNALTADERSTTGSTVVIGGLEYRTEIIPLRVD